MRFRHKVSLKPQEREQLKSMTSKGIQNARILRRCRILLMLDQGQKSGEIGKALSITTNTVRNVCKRYTQEGIQGALYDKPRPGAPLIFDGKARAKITALACSKAPDGRATWSLNLLSEKAVELGYVQRISAFHVSRILKKTKSNRISKVNGASVR